jgi:hypothetical protein
LVEPIADRCTNCGKLIGIKGVPYETDRFGIQNPAMRFLVVYIVLIFGIFTTVAIGLSFHLSQSQYYLTVNAAIVMLIVLLARYQTLRSASKRRMEPEKAEEKTELLLVQLTISNFPPMFQ